MRKLLLLTLTLLAGGLLQPAAASAPSRFNLPSQFELQAIDGKPVKRFLLTGQPDTLPAGDHQLLIQFVQLHDTSSEPTFVRSDTLLLEFRSAAGQSISLTAERPVNKVQARRFASSPEIALTDDATGEPVPFTLRPMTQKAYMAQTTAASLAKVSADAGQALQLEGTNKPLEQLIYWYRQADDETRKAFQIWAIQQQ